MGDVNKDGSIDFREFLNYCVEHEKKLRLVFQAMDTNKDGEAEEKSFGISIRRKSKLF